jgi:IS5 family transposase
MIPQPPKKNTSRYQANKLRKLHRRRAAIKPIIGHIKQNHRLNRNFYKGIVGDNINIMLAAAAFNFKRIMNKWKSSFGLFFCVFFSPNLIFRKKLVFKAGLNIISRGN